MCAIVYASFRSMYDVLIPPFGCKISIKIIFIMGHFGDDWYECKHVNIVSNSYLSLHALLTVMRFG